MSDDKISNEQALIRELAELLGETGLSEIEIERKGLRLRVARQVSVAANVAPMAAPVTATAAVPGAPATSADASDHPGAVTSPMVGTTYRSPEPGAAAFVEIGAKVQQGQTVLIVEAMKTMNHIPAPRAGTVTQVFVTDGQPVEYGEALMIIE